MTTTPDTTTTATNEAALAAALDELMNRNAAVIRQVRRGLSSPEYHAAYRAARAAYRAFWDMPGADDFAKRVLNR